MHKIMVRVKQHDHSDCGVACLASVAAHFRLPVAIAQLRQYAGTGTGGTNMFGLIRAAEKMGFHASGVRGNRESLSRIPLPAVAQLCTEKGPNHFVVIYKVRSKYLMLMDPRDGKMHRFDHESFCNQWSGVLLLLMPGGKFEQEYKGVSVHRRFWLLMKPHSSILAQAFTGALVFTLLGFATSIYIQKLTDYVFVGGNTNLLNLLSTIMLVLLLLQVYVAYVKDVYLTRTGQLIDFRLIMGYYRHLLNLPQSFFDSMQSGEILSRIGDAMKIRTFLNSVLLSLMVNSLILVFSFALMFTIYYKLALIMLAILPLYGAIYIITNHLNKRKERKVMEAAAQLESELVESLNSMEAIKQFGIEGQAYRKTESCFVQFLRHSYHSALNRIFSMNSTSFVSGLFTIILLWTGSYFVVNKAITPGELLSFYAIVGYFTAPVSRLINANKEIQKALIAADRLFEITDLAQDPAIKRHASKACLKGDIVFDRILFEYPGRPPLFKDLSLRLQAGSITAILGESGSGKTSLVNIMQQHYPIKSGKISIGETNLNYMDRTVLRDQLAMVPQQVHLFCGDIIDNIALGVPTPDIDKITQLCKMLGLSNFIDKQPNGLYTAIGENGALLSGGQKQRIAIARALYRDPSILILDEATSNLDSHSEHYITHAVLHFRNQGNTVIIITHRFSSIKHADTIICLVDGEVVEQGTHEDLFKNKSYYHSLYTQQAPVNSIVGYCSR